MIIYYCVRSLDGIPSCIYNIQLIHELGYKIVPLLGSCSSELIAELEGMGVEYRLMQDPSILRERGNIRQRLLKNIRYRAFVARILKKEAEPDSQVFIGTGDTAVALFDVVKNYRSVLVLKELYDTPRYYQTLLKRMSPDMSCVVCCEKNRSRLIQSRWGLKEIPFTVPNKPTNHPRTPSMAASSEQTAKIINEIKDSKVVLYQARHIHFVPELEELAKALKLLDRDYLLVMVGTVDSIEEIKKITAIYPKTYLAGHIRSPKHLEITSYAHIGVAVYQETTLNNLFCAPNKIYEYAGFGIPTLGNDIPGLLETVQIFGAGECTDWRDPGKIAQAIRNIEAHYELYSENATQLYENTDCSRILKEVINYVSGEQHDKKQKLFN